MIARISAFNDFPPRARAAQLGPEGGADAKDRTRPASLRIFSRVVQVGIARGRRREKRIGRRQAHLRGKYWPETTCDVAIVLTSKAKIFRLIP